MANYLSESDHARVSAAVAEAEGNSAGEIVTILTDRSDGYADVALAWSVLLAFAAMTALSVIPDFWLGLIDGLTGAWASEWTHREIAGLTVGTGVATFTLAMVAQAWLPLRLWLVPRAITARRVRARAETCFRIGAERRTTGRTGILIYLSMREHRAEIVADAAIAAEVGPQAWEKAMAAMLGHIRNSEIAAGMAAAVENVGRVLAVHCPRQDEDRNELPDRLIEV